MKPPGGQAAAYPASAGRVPSGKCSEENTIDLFKGMHHFQLGQKRNHLRNAAAHGFEEQDFSAEIRLKKSVPASFRKQRIFPPIITPSM